jgi:GR25 family glycosyltransferase involved in LPS biosynthesis
MRVHLINLDRDVDRLTKFCQINAHLTEIIRPRAIPGRELDPETLVSLGYISPGLRYNYASLGNAHSHVQLWKKAVETGSVITVAEDDAIFSLYACEASKEIIDYLPDDWDFIQWGWNYDAFLWVEIPAGVSACKIICDQDELRANIEHFRSTAMRSAPLRLRHSFGIMAYTVSPKGAAQLMRLCLPLRNMLIEFPGYGVVIENRTIDAMMNYAYRHMKAFICVPPIAVSENRSETSNTRRDP